MLVQFEGLLGLILVFVFCWAILGVCMCVCVCVGMCVYSGEQIGNQFYLSSTPYPSRNKTSLYICYFLFFSNDAQN